MPTTPRGTRTWRSSSPFGSREPRTTSPTGSGRATSERSASATPATRPASSRSRSRIASGVPSPAAAPPAGLVASRSRARIASGVPSPAAAATSSAFAARISSVRSTSASAIALSAASLVSVGRVRSTRAAARARSAAAPISGRSATSDTCARVRGTNPGSARTEGTQRGLAGLAGEPVEEELAVEVVDLVLQAAGHQPATREPQRLAVDIETLDDAVHGAHGGRPDSGHRQAALVAVLGLLRQFDDRRVHHVPDLAVDVVRERPDTHADLRGGQAGPAGVVDGLDEVAHQRGQVAVEGTHLVGGRAEHGVADLTDGTDGHGRSLSAE